MKRMLLESEELTWTHQLILNFQWVLQNESFSYFSSLQGLLERLAEGPIIGDGGFVFALERRGYVKAGPWTPEAAVENPDAGNYIAYEFYLVLIVHVSINSSQSFAYEDLNLNEHERSN